MARSVLHIFHVRRAPQASFSQAADVIARHLAGPGDGAAPSAPGHLQAGLGGVRLLAVDAPPREQGLGARGVATEVPILHTAQTAGRVQ